MKHRRAPRTVRAIALLRRPSRRVYPSESIELSPEPTAPRHMRRLTARRPLMPFVIWSRRSMSSQRIRFVEARTARMIAVIALIALLIAALALGMAIGTTFARSHLGEE